MKLFYLFVRLSIAFSLSIISFFVLFFGLQQLFWISIVSALGGGLLAFGSAQSYSYFKFLKQHQLTRNEYAFIKKNLAEAKHKVKRIKKAYLAVRSIRSFRQIFSIHRLVKRIYTIVRNEPKRFYQAERFFFYHLDSLVELTEKHAFLATQSLNNGKIKGSLRETQDMIDTLIQSVERDLDNLLSTDVDQLTFELDVAKQSLQTWTDPLKGRRSKS